MQQIMGPMSHTPIVGAAGTGLIFRRPYRAYKCAKISIMIEKNHMNRSNNSKTMQHYSTMEK